MFYQKFNDAKSVFDKWNWELVEQYYPEYCRCPLITHSADMDLCMENADHVFDFNQTITPASFAELKAVCTRLSESGQMEYDVDIMEVWADYADPENSFFAVRNRLYTHIWTNTLPHVPDTLLTLEQKQWFASQLVI